MGCLKLHIDTEPTLSVAYRKNGQKPLKKRGSYYPFGLKHKGYNNVTSSLGNSVAQKFKYNGVELEESLGLNLYEMDFRLYDPAIGRFNGIDPVTHFSQGTSVAFDNNPIYWADPSGADSTTEWMEKNELTDGDLINIYDSSDDDGSGDDDHIINSNEGTKP